METRAPSIGQILVAVGFALSCFGLLLLLWLSFGGPVPLKSTGYRVTVPVQEATQLAVESDVRISGVSVGKVKELELSEGGNDTLATIQLDNKYAPIPSDTRAILRQKTLLGETYIELTPGSPEAEPIPEDGDLAAAQVADSVQLDEIFRAFDEPTREAFRVWMQDGGTAVEGRGADFNAALGTLDPFTAEGAELLRTLDRQRLAVRGLVRDGGEVFEALSERRAVRGLIENSEAVFSTTAARNAELADLFRVFPTFLDESRLTLGRLDEFATDTDPLITQLRPVARELSPTLVDFGRLAPRLETFFDGLLPVTKLSRPGFGATRRLLEDRLTPLLERLTPFSNQLVPVLEVLRAYRRETTAALANVAAASNAFVNPEEGEGRQVRYLRTTAPINPESLAGFPRRLGINRTNPYVKPGGYTKLAETLESFQTNHCGAAGATAILDLDDAGEFPGDLLERIHRFAFADAPVGAGNEVSTDDVPAPRCVKQAQYESIGRMQELSDYLHVRPSR